MTVTLRSFATVLGLLALAACARPAGPEEPLPEMGNFRLGHNVVVVNEPQIGPFSRRASDEEWEQELKAAIERRFGGYAGEKLYHLGVKLDGYALARAGIPVVMTPRSFLVVTVNMWDDAARKRVNAEEKAISVFEGLSGRALVGSGLTMNRRQQMRLLADNMARAIQDWILENPEWIGLPAATGAAGSDASATTDATGSGGAGGDVN